jgi:leucyl-tRNA---protein transferase
VYGSAFLLIEPIVKQQRNDFGNPDFYVTAPQPCPYLPGRIERKLFTHMSRAKSPEVLDNLLRSGFRRSQNIAYTPSCKNCQACVSVRVLASEFTPARSFRRTLNANTDLVARQIEPMPSAEQYALFRDYVRSRHGEGGMAEMSEADYAMMVGDSVIDTFLTEYRQLPTGSTAGSDGNWDNLPLVAVSLNDRLSDGYSMVYSFFSPALASRGLGTYMILDTIAQARATGLAYVYLGYWVDGSRKMSYKSRFLPQETLQQPGWVRRD